MEALWTSLSELCADSWFGGFLWILATWFTYEAVICWKVRDVMFGVLQTPTAIGLWLHEPWGVVGFVLVAVSQLVLFLGFPDRLPYIKTVEDRASLRISIWQRVVALVVFVVLLVMRSCNA